jgi:hypothetical protein
MSINSEVPLEPAAQCSMAPTVLSHDHKVRKQIVKHLETLGYNVGAILHIECMPEEGTYFVKYRVCPKRYKKSLIRPIVVKLAACAAR